MTMSHSEKSQALENELGLGTREFFTVSQLADMLQLTEMTIYRMINRGDLPCYAIGRIKRFRQRDIEDFLESHRLPAGPHKSNEPRRTAARRK
jgi:excisionase family DNA binding protein